MARALKTILALAIGVTTFSVGGVILPVDKAQASECIYRYNHKYCRADYWRGDCFWYHYELYCRVYPKKKKHYKKYYQGDGGY